MDRVTQRELARKSVARISFKWRPRPTRNNKKDTLTVVISGVIVSIKDDGTCLVVADPIFFQEKNCPFVVNLPTATGYDAVPVAPSAKFLGNAFCTLVLPANDYVRPVTVETRAVETCDGVSALVFPQKAFLTPTGYVPGHVVHGEEGQPGKFGIEISFHSYAHFGSPIFDKSGHLVGISYAPMDAWSVNFIQEALRYENDIRSVLGTISYVLNGNPIPPEGTALPETAPPV